MNTINLGKLVEERLRQMKMTKSEFAKKIEIPQQNVNRLLEKSSIETERLVLICKALDYNFFRLFDNRTIGVENPPAARALSLPTINGELSESLMDVEEIRNLVSSREHVLEKKIMTLQDSLLETQKMLIDTQRELLDARKELATLSRPN